jgi:WD40 repeat protein
MFMASSADKFVTLYETLTGNILTRTTCGEVTLAMSLSTNLRHLITASMDGIIYVWRLPESLTKTLLKMRAEPP